MAGTASITFDTLRFANRLKDAGVPPAQAEAEAVALSEVLDVNLRELATKEDLRQEMKAFETRIESRLETLELRLTIKLGVFMAGAAGIFGAIVKLM